MAKLFWLVSIALLVYWLLRQRATSSQRPDDVQGASEVMVRCAHCGLNVPQGESILADGKHFCSEEHRHLASRSSRAE